MKKGEVTDLMRACRDDIERAGGVKAFARASGIRRGQVYNRTSGYYPVTGRFLEAVITITGGEEALAVIQSWRPSEANGSPVQLMHRLVSESGVFAVQGLADVHQDGLVSDERTVRWLYRLHAQVGRLLQHGRRAVRRLRRSRRMTAPEQLEARSAEEWASAHT